MSPKNIPATVESLHGRLGRYSARKISVIDDNELTRTAPGGSGRGGAKGVPAPDAPITGKGNSPNASD